MDPSAGLGGVFPRHPHSPLLLDASCQIPTGPAGSRGPDRHLLRTQVPKSKCACPAQLVARPGRAGCGVLLASGVCLWACVQGMECKPGREGSGPALLISSTDELYVARGSCEDPAAAEVLFPLAFPASWRTWMQNGSRELGREAGGARQGGAGGRGDMAATRVHQMALRPGPQATAEQGRLCIVGEGRAQPCWPGREKAGCLAAA